MLLKLLKGVVGIPRGAAGDLEAKGRGGNPIWKKPPSWRHKRATASPAKSTMWRTSEGDEGQKWGWQCFGCGKMNFNNDWQFDGCEYCGGDGNDLCGRDAPDELMPAALESKDEDDKDVRGQQPRMQKKRHQWNEDRPGISQDGAGGSPLWREAQGAEVPEGHEDWRRPPEVWITEKYAVTNDVLEEAVSRLQFDPEVDAFSEAATARFPRWWGPGSAEGTDAFKMSWKDIMMWVNPPYSKWNEVLNKVQEDKARILAVIPVWPDRIFFKRAMAMVEASWVVPAGRHVFFLPGHQVGPTRWPVMFGLMNGDRHQKEKEKKTEDQDGNDGSGEKLSKSAKRAQPKNEIGGGVRPR